MGTMTSFKMADDILTGSDNSLVQNTLQAMNFTNDGLFLWRMYVWKAIPTILEKYACYKCYVIEL